MGAKYRITAVSASPLSVPLREPFVIATARMDATRAALVRATLERTSDGARDEGVGEAAALPPVTREDQPELMASITASSSRLVGSALDDLADLSALLDRTFADRPVARAALETACIDAMARLEGRSFASALGGVELSREVLTTDVTLPIAEPASMADGARRWRQRGFRCFKVKVGRAWERDLDALLRVRDVVPDARFRLDANEGFGASTALALLDAVLRAGLEVECFEQPCARDDWAGMSEVSAATEVPVVADESLRSPVDLDRIVETRAARGINLKLVKLGGPIAALAIARRARAAGLKLMAGAMVETRLGLVAMAHVVATLGGVEWVDLDTAMLLEGDPFEGGWTMNGAEIELEMGVGLGVALRR
jgi:L-Ala-D/L-Glu epimerase